MRIITDLPDRQVEFLTQFCQEEDISRAEAIRRAISEMEQRAGRQKILQAGFGIWKGKLKVDALDYVERVREGGAIDELFNE